MDERLGLQETGTRWEHYSELRELFACGIEILKNLSVKSPTDREKQKKLEGAVELLDGRINLLADYHFHTTYGSKLRAIVDFDVDAMYRRMKKEQADAAQASKKPEDNDSEGPETNPSK